MAFHCAHCGSTSVETRVKDRQCLNCGGLTAEDGTAVGTTGPAIPRTGPRTWDRALEDARGIPAFVDTSGLASMKHPTLVSSPDGDVRLVDTGGDPAPVTRTPEAEATIAEITSETSDAGDPDAPRAETHTVDGQLAVGSGSEDFG